MKPCPASHVTCSCGSKKEPATASTPDESPSSGGVSGNINPLHRGADRARGARVPEELSQERSVTRGGGRESNSPEEAPQAKEIKDLQARPGARWGRGVRKCTSPGARPRRGGRILRTHRLGGGASGVPPSPPRVHYTPLIGSGAPTLGKADLDRRSFGLCCSTAGFSGSAGCARSSNCHQSLGSRPGLNREWKFAGSSSTSLYFVEVGWL